jgi:hypothetical protein
MSRIVKLIEDQNDYKIFEKDTLVLKWNRSSDYSRIYIEIVEKFQDEDHAPARIFLGTRFPAKFPIIGNTTYNKPLKLETQDPHLVKLIDH